MRGAKLTISTPSETMTHVDRVARRLGMTRSRYVAVVLARVAACERDDAVSRKVDAVLAKLEPQDLAPVAHLHAARRDPGTEW